MADVSQITVGETTYDIKDATARGAMPPDGGTSGQVLAKASATDYDFEWVNQSGGGGGSVTTWYGTCSSAQNAQVKAVTCSGFTLTTGAFIAVKFTNPNNYGAIKLNVNSTGDKAVYHRGAVTSANNFVTWNISSIVYFIYDGTGWCFLGSSDGRIISAKSRLSSANRSVSGTGAVDHLICKTNTMTTGTPACDGHILDFDWDASYSNHSQLFLPDMAGYFPQWRTQNGGTWTAWDTFYTEANPPENHWEDVSADFTLALQNAGFSDVDCKVMFDGTVCTGTMVFDGVSQDVSIPVPPGATPSLPTALSVVDLTDQYTCAGFIFGGSLELVNLWLNDPPVMMMVSGTWLCDYVPE